MSKKIDIFFSYSHDDVDVAKDVIEQLEKQGLKCFLAEKDIVAGEHWQSRIREAILEADLVLLLMTPRSKNSLWIAAEAGAAWALEKDLIAALRYVEASELIEPIRQHQYRVVENSQQIKALAKELSKKEAFESNLISGQWFDSARNAVLYFKQDGNRVVGFYDYGTGDRKVAVYRGTFDGSSLEYHWKWLNGRNEGHGIFRLSANGKRLSGEWWRGSSGKKEDTEFVDYERVSSEAPRWVDERDFEEYA